MSEIKFFTPIHYGALAKSAEEKAIENIDNYFNICGKKAVVIPGRTDDGKEKVIFQMTRFSIQTFFKTIGVALSVFTVIIPLVMLISKAILRSSHHYKLIDPKKEEEVKVNLAPVQEIISVPKEEIDPGHQPVDPVKQPKKEIDIAKEKVKDELGKGIDIKPSTIAKIQALVPKILDIEKMDEIEYLKGSKVFRLKETPNFVFKLGTESSGSLHKGKIATAKEIMEDRFENMIKAKEVCLVNNLALLIIPHSKKFTFDTEDGQKCVLIAEESMDINHEESAQEEFYHKYSKGLNETARQLAIFVAKTGFNDVTPRNIPIINEAENFMGHRSVALIDLEHMESPVKGFIGDHGLGSRGLIRCVVEEQIDIVIDEARKNGIHISDYEKEERLKEIESYNRLKQYHEKKGIVQGKEPVVIDLDSLGLDLEEEGEIRVKVNDKFETQTVTLKKATEDVVAEINRLIQNNSDQESMKGKRYILLKSKKPFSEYENLGIPEDKMDKLTPQQSAEEKRNCGLIVLFKR